MTKLMESDSAQVNGKICEKVTVHEASLARLYLGRRDKKPLVTLKTRIGGTAWRTKNGKGKMSANDGKKKSRHC